MSIDMLMRSAGPALTTLWGAAGLQPERADLFTHSARVKTEGQADTVGDIGRGIP